MVMMLSALPVSVPATINRESDAPAPAQDAGTFQELLSKLSAPAEAPAPRAGTLAEPVPADAALPENLPAVNAGQESTKPFSSPDTNATPASAEEKKKAEPARSEAPSAGTATPIVFFPAQVPARLARATEPVAMTSMAAECISSAVAERTPGKAVAGSMRSHTARPIDAAREAPADAPAAAQADSKSERQRAPADASRHESSVRQAADFAAGGQALPQTTTAPDLPAPFSPERPAAAPVPAGAAPHAAVLRLGETGWEGGLGAKIVWMAAQRQQVAELHVSPPDLGPVKIVLALEDGKADAQFISAHAPVRAALEQALPQLQQMLAHSGITLSNATVSSDFFPGQDPARGRDPGPQGSAPDATTIRTLQPLRLLRGLVDTFA